MAPERRGPAAEASPEPERDPDASGDPEASADDSGRRTAGRSLLVAVAVGVGVALAMAALVYAVVAVPFYALARFTEPQQGLDRPLIRDGIRLALPIGLGVGMLVGVIVGAWYARGGRLPPAD